MNTRERRSAKRIPVNIDCMLSGENASPKGHVTIIRDVSAGGIFVETDGSVEAGSALEVSVPDTDIRMPVTAVRTETSPRQGIAFSFVEADPRQIIKLLSLALDQ